jgi:HK97 family phage major capsid protein
VPSRTWAAGAAELTAAVLPLPVSVPGARARGRAPGTVLDSQPWARDWASFLRAVNDPMDSSARTVIMNAAMSERVGTEGGFLVPENLRQQVLSYMAAAVVRPQAMVLPMSSYRLPVPILDNPSQASSAQVLGGLTFAFTEEGAAITGSVPGFGRVVLEARKAAALMTVPNELADDAAGAFGDFLARVIAKGYGWVEDDYFIGTNGTGVGCPQSLINAPCAVSVTRLTASSVTQVDIAKMFKALHPAAKMSGYTPGYTHVRWLISASAMDQILELYLAIGTPANQAVAPSDWFQAGDGDRTGPSMLGLPVTVTDHQPAVGTRGDVMLADLSEYLIGDRQVMTVERADQSLFGNDQSYVRVRAMVDGRYWVQTATTTTAGQSVSPVVVLN